MESPSTSPEFRSLLRRLVVKIVCSVQSLVRAFLCWLFSFRFIPSVMIQCISKQRPLGVKAFKLRHGLVLGDPFSDVVTYTGIQNVYTQLASWNKNLTND